MKKAIYVERVYLGDDDVMKSNAEVAIFARNMVQALSKQVDFPEEE